MGPTAAGKTALALELSERYPCDLINVDSAQVYRGLDIGSAKASASLLRRYPHALIDIRDPEQSYSAANFAQDARPLIAHALERQRIPVLVGGTMLYFKALFDGLNRLPKASAPLRESLENQAQKEGWPALHRKLQALDPETAAKLEPSDAQRIGRALEVIELTGSPMSQLLQEAPESRFEGRVHKLVVSPKSRAVLHERIAARFDAMLADGFLSEMEALMKRPELTSKHSAMRSVGYRQAWEFLGGSSNHDEFRLRTIAATNQLAKRQLTWLRTEPETLWYDATEDLDYPTVFNGVDRFLESVA